MNSKIVMDGITFDDVLLIPRESQVIPKDICLKTRLTNDIEMNMPLISAAMDTVTEAKWPSRWRAQAASALFIKTCR